MFRKFILVNNLAKEDNMKEKFIKGLKKYRGYLYSVLAVVLVALILTLSLAASKPKQEGEVVVNTDPIKFAMPISNATILMGYDAEEPQYIKDLNCWEIHKGLDLLASVGDEVLACYDGTVTKISNNYLDGTIIEITHKDGIVSVYKGLSNETKVKVNDVVTLGQAIGTVGDANESETGSHVHFEIIKDNEKIDPLSYIEISGKD